MTAGLRLPTGRPQELPLAGAKSSLQSRQVMRFQGDKHVIERTYNIILEGYFARPMRTLVPDTSGAL